MAGGINGVSLNRTSSSTLGLRITGFKLGCGPNYNNGSMNILHIDRCHCEYLEDSTKKAVFNVGGSIAISGGMQHCYVKGEINCASKDMQLWDIRQEDIYPGEGGGNSMPAGSAAIDMMRTDVTQWNSDDNVFRAQIRFVRQFNRQGMDNNGHQDSWQWQNGSAAAGRHAGPRVVCLWTVPGDRRVSTGTFTDNNGNTFPGKLLEGGTEGIFHSPISSSALCDGQYMGPDPGRELRDVLGVPGCAGPTVSVPVFDGDQAGHDQRVQHSATPPASSRRSSSTPPPRPLRRKSPRSRL
jgi:hypothetical protein